MNMKTKRMYLSYPGILSDGYYLLIFSASPLIADDPTPLHIQAEVTLKTNFFGTRDICTELLPLVKPQGEPDEGPKLCCFWHDPAPELWPHPEDPGPAQPGPGLLAVPPPGEVSSGL